MKVASDVAPIRELPAWQVPAAGRALNASVEESAPPRDSGPQALLAADAASMSRFFLRDRGHDSVAAYEIDGGVAALMRTSPERNGLHVIDLVAHPLSRGAGTALIEFAVNKSAREGLHGVLRLDPLNGAVAAYEAMGFVWNAKDEQMVLDPNRSPLWTLGESGWRFKPDAQKGYVSSLG